MPFILEVMTSLVATLVGRESDTALTGRHYLQLAASVAFTQHKITDEGLT